MTSNKTRPVQARAQAAEQAQTPAERHAAGLGGSYRKTKGGDITLQHATTGEGVSLKAEGVLSAVPATPAAAPTPDAAA